MAEPGQRTRAQIEREIKQLERRIRQVQSAANKAIKLPKPAMTAHMHALRLAIQLDAQLAVLRVELEGLTEDLSELPEEEFLARLELAARDMPDAHLEVFVREYEGRYRFRVVGGTDTEDG